MGVRGLQSYMQQQCPDGCKRVSLKEKADEHKRKFNCSPELVVDGLCLTCELYNTSGLDWIYGGQYLQFKILIKNLVMNFKNAGVDLVFFFDGTVCSDKHEEWVRRRLAKYNAISNIFCDVKSNSKLTDDSVSVLPPALGLITAFYLKELGVKVYQTAREADDDIIDYAERNTNVFGILSQDSDFIICNTKEYFSLLYLDLESLHTIHYDRHCLANKLQLNINQLPLFACLAGNHFVPYEKLRPFHSLLLDGPVYPTALYPSLSSLIRHKNWTGNLYNLNQLKQISKFVFRNESGIKMIKDGLKSYVVKKSSMPPFKALINIPKDLERDFYDRFIECSLSTPIFNILFKLRFNSAEVLEDVSAKPSALIYREIRQRCYGILFNSSSEGTMPERRNVNEYCAYHGNQLESPELVEALPLKKLIEGRAPTLTDIRYSLTESEKYQVFLSIWQLPMDLDVLMEIPKNFLVFSCIVNFLIGGSSSGPHLKPFDVVVFVAQAIWEKNASEINQLEVPLLDDEAINLTSLFMRGLSMAVLALEICNYPFCVTHAMPWHFFDGKLFHYLYSKAKKRCSVFDLCQSQSTSTELFYHLLSVVTKNTEYDFEKFDWNTVLVDFEC